MARTKFADLRAEVAARSGAEERLAAARVATLEEIRLYELRHAAASARLSWPIHLGKDFTV